MSRTHAHGAPQISDFGLRTSDLPTALSRRQTTSLLKGSLLLVLLCASACLAQRQNEPRPAPMDPVQAEQEARLRAFRQGVDWRRASGDPARAELSARYELGEKKAAARLFDSLEAVAGNLQRALAPFPAGNPNPQPEGPREF